MFTKEKILYTDLRNIRTVSELYAFDIFFEHHNVRVLSTTVCSSYKNNRDRGHNIMMSVLVSLENFPMKSRSMSLRTRSPMPGNCTRLFLPLLFLNIPSQLICRYISEEKKLCKYFTKERI